MSNAEELIIETLRDKASLKLDVHKLTLDIFQELKHVLREVTNSLSEKASAVDERLKVEYYEDSPLSVQIRTAGDVVVFEMHSNVFFFDSQHKVWNLSYTQEDQNRAFCGVINIYNFLSDTIKFKRTNDVGYLIGRIFLNKEKHFMVEGKRQMGFLYNNFATDVFDKAAIREVILSAVLYCLFFDLFHKLTWLPCVVCRVSRLTFR